MLSSACPVHSRVSVVVSPLSLPSYHELKHTKRGTCWRVHKLYVNSYTSVINLLRTDIHTYKHNIRLRPQKCPPRPHNYVPHTKAFGNQKHSLCIHQDCHRSYNLSCFPFLWYMFVLKSDYIMLKHSIQELHTAADTLSRVSLL